MYLKNGLLRTEKCGFYNRVVATGGHTNKVVTFNEDTALTIGGRINRAGLMVKLRNSLISLVFTLTGKTCRKSKETNQIDVWNVHSKTRKHKRHDGCSKRRKRPHAAVKRNATSFTSLSILTVIDEFNLRCFLYIWVVC